MGAPGVSGGSVRAYVGLGANLDDPAAHVRRAFEDLGRIAATRCVSRSRLYRNPPMGPADQPDYVNAAAALDTRLPPPELLAALQAIERAHGRTRDGVRWGPRTLDLDLLLYGDLESDDPRLTLPHPGLHRRAFVLYPLLEIAPGLAIPGRGPLAALAAAVPGTGLQALAESP